MVNYTAVMKLLKKRDKMAGTTDKMDFMAEVMADQPFAMCVPACRLPAYGTRDCFPRREVVVRDAYRSHWYKHAYADSSPHVPGLELSS